MKITEEVFTQAMRDAVAERGEDWVYPIDPDRKIYNDSWHLNGQCRYVRADVDEPACLIGVALHRCGVSLDELRLHEGLEASPVIADVAGLRRDTAVAQAAYAAQGVQDNGGTWGEALATYLGVLDRENGDA